MTEHKRPQLHPNELQRVNIDADSLRRTLAELEAAIAKGIRAIISESPSSAIEDYGALGTGQAGTYGWIAMLCLLRTKSTISTLITCVLCS